jgi:hypothetical protein
VRRGVWIAVIAVWALASTGCPAVAADAEPALDPTAAAATEVPPVQTAPDGSTDGAVEPESPPLDQPATDPAAGEEPAPAPATADQPASDPAAGEQSATEPVPDEGAAPDAEAASDEGAAPDAEAAPEAPESAPPAPPPAKAGQTRPHTHAAAPPVRPAVVPLASGARTTAPADPITVTTVQARSAHARATSPWTTAPLDSPTPAAGFALPLQGVIAVLQPETAGLKTSAPQRDPDGRAHRPKVTSQPRDSERDSRLPLRGPSHDVAASAAGAGSTAPPTLWCAIFAACLALAALELRRLGARLLVPDAPGAFSLRDRPG